jgi:hypothetical protein
LGKRARYGALAGFVFSGPGNDFSFDRLKPLVWFFRTLSMAVFFGLPAGFLLGWLDSSRGNENGWQAVVKVPVQIIAGSLLLFVICAIPITIYIVSRWGSDATAGAIASSVSRRVIGCFAGVLFGLLIVPLYMRLKQICE